MRILTKTTSPVKSLGGFGKNDFITVRKPKIAEIIVPTKNSALRKNHILIEGIILELGIVVSSLTDSNICYEKNTD